MRAGGFAFLQASLQLSPRGEEVVIAVEAADADVGSQALHSPGKPTAGVRLAKSERVTQGEGNYHGRSISCRVAVMRARIDSASRRAASAKLAPFEA